MIDIRKLKELVRLMVDNDLTELDLRDSEEQVTMRRGAFAGSPQVYANAAPLIHAMPAAGAPVQAVGIGAGAAGNGAASSSAQAAGAATAVEDDAGLVRIESPMVGTFYATPNPDSPPFVTIGTTVAPDKVVCIIEAMKIFNEIKAECAGVVQKILVKSGDAVEFGQPLFLVKPS
jgi:acetyl-CoA carboxylase biotin carboxyl carrier protein